MSCLDIAVILNVAWVAFLLLLVSLHVVAFIPAVACVPAVVSGLDIAVILNVAWVGLLLLLVSLLLLSFLVLLAFLLL